MTWPTADDCWCVIRGMRVASTRGSCDDAFLRDMLAETRRKQFRSLNTVPAGATDLRMYHVSVENVRTGIRL